jgi:hypothetical protein
MTDQQYEDFISLGKYTEEEVLKGLQTYFGKS